MFSQSKNYYMKNKLLKTLTMVGLLLMSVQGFAQAPPLGTAGDFVLFSTVGAVGNTGISQITGNVGTNSGAITGFGNVNGVMNASNGATAQCAADLLNAYNLLNSTIPDFFPAPLLGNGQILGAGVYDIAGPATLNNELTLDAQNDPDAVFIFKINGAFSTAALSSVTLINGAQACNVFWKVEGLVDMASGTTMRGTVIANNGAININTDGLLEGRALSTSGAVNVSGTLAFTPIGCGSPTLMGPTAPDLVSAGCYAVFSSNGPVSNAGITYVVGDVGTNVGLTTGFNPLFVSGEVHPIPDGSTAAAAADLLNAYNYLNALPFDIELLYPAQFGNDLVLTPHTYLLNAATTFAGDLYLNAGGEEDAVFVIQINGALTTSTFANVILINGTQSKNVFWKVDGAVAVNDNSNFVGTIIANNAAVEVNTGVNLEGRAFTTTGALSVVSAIISSPPGCPCEPIYSSGKIEGDLISNFEILGTTLANNTGTDAVNPAFTYFTGQPNYTADLEQGGSYNISITIGTRGDQAVRVWIDFNDDGVFDDSESIGSTTVAPGGGINAGGFPPAIFNVNIPNDAPLGMHRMRVRSAYAEDAATLNPCALYAFGETEEYDITIIIENVVGPDAPANNLACDALPIRTNIDDFTPELNTYGFISDIISCDNPSGNNTLATSDAEGTPCNGTQGLSMWYTFTTPMCDLNGAVPFEIELSTNNTGTDFNTKVYLFSSTTNVCSDLVQIACNDDHNGIGYASLCGDVDGTSSTVVSSALMPNTQYWVKVDGLNMADAGNFTISGRAIAPAHGVQAVGGGTQIQLTTGNMGAQLYSYLYKQVGSSGYSIKNSQTALTDTRTLSPGFSYSTQLMYRCDANFFNQSQWYKTESQTITLELTCAVVSDMTCAFNGPNAYTLTWTQPAGELFTNNGALTGYRIKRNPVGSTGVYIFSNPAVVCVNGTCSVTLPGNSPSGFNWTIETRCTANNVQVGNTTSCGPGIEMPLGNDISNNVNKTMQHTFSFVNAEAGIEFVDVQMHDAYADFGLNTPMIGDYEIFVKDNNEISWRRVETTFNTNFDFVIVPNPSNAMTTVHLNTVVEAGTFTIVDALGRTIQTGSINSTDKINFDAAQLQSGVYVVVVSVGNQKMTRRLVVVD
jgi:hypothetical protein